MSATSAQRHHGYLHGVGGLRLHYRSWEAAGTPRAALVVVHGLTEHSGRYDELGESMAAHAISTFAMDLRGHGSSDGRRGHVPRFEVFLQDLDRFRREVQGLVDPACPLFLLGQSLGGLIVLRYLEEYDAPFRGGIIVSPWLATAVEVPRWKATAARLLERVLPAFPFSIGIRGEQLSHDAAVVAAYRDDPLVHGRITPRLFAETSIAMGQALQRRERIAVPILFLLGGEDHLVDIQRALAFARSLSRPDITLDVFPGMLHEPLNEVGRREVRLEIRDWLVSHL